LTPSSEDSAAAIKALYVTRGGYSHEQVDQAGVTLVQTVHKAVSEAFSKTGHAKIGLSSVITGGIGYGAPSEYRPPLGGPQVLQFTANSAPPARAEVERRYGLILPKDAAGEDDIQLMRINPPNPNDAFIARVDELIPGVTGILSIRLTMFAERIASEMLAELRGLAESAAGRRR